MSRGAGTKTAGHDGRPGRLGPRLVGAAVLVLSCVLSAGAPSYGQGLPPLEFGGESPQRRPDLLDQKAPPPPATVTLPPLPASEQEGTEVPLRSVLVSKVVVTGSTVFGAAEIAGVTSPYENRWLTMEGLESLRRELTLLYVNKGYVNSGAVLPDQTVGDGVVTVQIVEGRLDRIEVEGNKGFRASFLRDRIALGAGSPVNVASLQDRLQLLQQDPRIQAVHAELRPGARPGESELKVRVEERPPLSLWLAFNNYQSPSVGAERGLATVAHQNLTGHGDVASVTYGYSDGLNPLIDAWYAFPLNAHDTALSFRYRKNDTKVVDRVFGPLDIVSKSESYELALRQPVYRSLSQDVALALSAERERNRTYLSDEPYSFSEGVDDGRSTVIPVRFTQEWTYRTQRQVLAAKSRFSLGLSSFGATTHDDGDLPDGQFLSWLGQLQWARVLSLWDVQLLARVDLQRSRDPLLPIEQIGVGGRYSVRGYRENQLVRDEAFIASLESRVPVVQNERWAEYLQVCGFVDYGSASNVRGPASGTEDLSSVGLGLRWAASAAKVPLTPRVDAEIYWGYALRDLEEQGENLQDAGIHFQLAVTGYF